MTSAKPTRFLPQGQAAPGEKMSGKLLLRLNHASFSPDSTRDISS
jgi:hypothetical protein